MVKLVKLMHLAQVGPAQKLLLGLVGPCPDQNGP